MSQNLIAAALVPGLPHVLSPELNSHYKNLAEGLEAIGDRFHAEGVERVIYYSTQWISVLGHLYQAKKDLQGLHVDENWYALGDLPFDFKVDVPFAQKLAQAASAKGYQTKLVDYEGFPVDTGTIVADRLLNKGRFKTNMVSCCVYSDFADTIRLAGTVRGAIDEGGAKTAVVCVSMLSGRWFTTDMDPREDHVSSPDDDQWNKRMLELFEKGQFDQAEKLIPEYAGAARVDMGFKAMAFLRGVGALKQGNAAKLHAYGPIYGTGAAVVEF
jgi:2-aminophenol/2-amino-5-chlorophenol 1,6-dioxygenase alpha subunit